MTERIDELVADATDKIDAFMAPKEYRAQALKALSDELRDLMDASPSGHVYAYQDVVQVASALYELAKTEQQYFPYQHVSPGDE